MMQIDIASVPNQSLTVRLGNAYYAISLKSAAGIMAVSVVRDNVMIVNNARAVAGEPILPYRYMEDGNFAITTLNGDLPDWQKFGQSQFLVYASAEELAGLRQ